jgi:hypothetical protein
MLVRAASRSSNCTGRPVFCCTTIALVRIWATTDEITDTNLDHVAPAQLAVDGEVEQCPITKSSLVIEPEANGPDLLWLQGSLCTYDPTGVPCTPLASRRIIL